MILGRLQQQSGEFQAFIPSNFPPQENWHFCDKIFYKATSAALLLGRLDGITQFIFDAENFLPVFLNKEAKASIEIDLEPYEESISDYVLALNWALKNSPSTKLIREIHQRIIPKNSGDFRKNQNWIGSSSLQNAIFVPPPAEEIDRVMNDLEKFFFDQKILSLIKIALIHAQFETIHPFNEGNGRVGRALITFFLHHEKLLEKPFLSLSEFFKKHRKNYFEKLENYHFGEVEEWIDFFLDAVCESASEAILALKKISALREEDMKKIAALGKTESESALKILPELFQNPVTNVARIQNITGYTRAGAQKVIDRFVNLEILAPKDENQKYGREFFYRRYAEIFS